MAIPTEMCDAYLIVQDMVMYPDTSDTGYFFHPNIASCAYQIINTYSCKQPKHHMNVEVRKRTMKCIDNLAEIVGESVYNIIGKTASNLALSKLFVAGCRHEFVLITVVVTNCANCNYQMSRDVWIRSSALVGDRELCFDILEACGEQGFYYVIHHVDEYKYCSHTFSLQNNTQTHHCGHYLASSYTRSMHTCASRAPVVHVVRKCLRQNRPLYLKKMVL